jgi:hypothetical protein
MKGRIIEPVFGEVIELGTLICARIRTKSGRTYLNTNSGKGFGSKHFALEFVNKTMREGMLLPHFVKVA